MFQHEVSVRSVADQRRNCSAPRNADLVPPRFLGKDERQADDNDRKRTWQGNTSCVGAVDVKFSGIIF